MKDIMKASFITEMCELTANIYRMGWAERNGGNISYLLTESEAGEYLDLSKTLRTIPVAFDASRLSGRYFLVTGTGKYFKNVQKDPETNLGIIRIAPDGGTVELLWGFRDGGSFTSELPAHLMSHMVRLEADGKHRVVLHTHPTYTIAMNTICPADETAFTRRLWQLNTECIAVFPDGVGLLPWMVCGTDEIGRATAEKMRSYRLVVWTNHGIYGAGASFDEAFGLIETVEKTAQIYMLTEGCRRENLISDEQLAALAVQFRVIPKAGVLR